MSLTDNFDKLFGSSLNNQGESTETGGEEFALKGNVRNLCFVMPDGSRHFLNYAYLLGGQYFSMDDSIILRFSFCEVKIKGYNLETLLLQLLEQLPQIILVKDARYVQFSGNQKPEVTSFEISFF